jgi:hypothetical protein
VSSSPLDRLLQTPPAELVSELKSLRDQRAGIESREAVLEQLLDLIARQGGPVAEEVARLGGDAAIGPLRNQIIQVLASKRKEGEPLMVPQGVHQELTARGNRAVTLDNVRVTMKRMAESGEIERVSPDGLVFGLVGIAQSLPPGMLDAITGGQQQ